MGPILHTSISHRPAPMQAIHPSDHKVVGRKGASSVINTPDISAAAPRIFLVFFISFHFLEPDGDSVLPVKLRTLQEIDAFTVEEASPARLVGA